MMTVPIIPMDELHMFATSVTVTLKASLENLLIHEEEFMKFANL